MPTITLTNHKTSVEAVEVGDVSSDQAIKMAEQLLLRGYSFDKALIDRFDGLVLIGSSGSWRFQCANCGYGGTGPVTSAKILAMFGFGDDERKIFEEIRHGGDTAKATLYR